MNISPRMAVNRLIVAMIQDEDAENAVQGLTKLGFVVTRLPSRGGFLKRRNVTLMVGMPAGLEEAAVRALKNSCKQRIEFVNNILPVSALPMPKPVEIKVGGAIMFVFEVEKYMEF
jgi:uncharacterized protein YaaQ